MVNHREGVGEGLVCDSNDDCATKCLIVAFLFPGVNGFGSTDNFEATDFCSRSVTAEVAGGPRGKAKVSNCPVSFIL